MTKPIILITAGLCAGGVLAPSASSAQAHCFLRLAPEVGRMTVEHTKTVTTPPVGSSSSTSSSSGLALAGILSAGLRLTLSGNWLVGGEIEGVFPNRHKLEGTIVPTPNGNVHDIWPGQWDFSDLFGAGGNIIFGREVGDGRSKVYVFGGMRRTRTEFASGWMNPATGAPGEDRARLGRWPWTISGSAHVGVTAPNWVHIHSIRRPCVRHTVGWRITSVSL